MKHLKDIREEWEKSGTLHCLRLPFSLAADEERETLWEYIGEENEQQHNYELKTNLSNESAVVVKLCCH